MNNITIEKSPGYKCGDAFYPCLCDAQAHALEMLFEGKSRDEIPRWIIANKDSVICILTGTKPRKPRADRGKSHRKPQTPAEVKDSPEPGVLPGVKVEASSKYRNK